MESREKTRQVEEDWSQQLEHKEVPTRGQNRMSGRVNVPFWHATSVSNALWKPLVIDKGQVRYQGHKISNQILYQGLVLFGINLL